MTYGYEPEYDRGYREGSSAGCLPRFLRITSIPIALLSLWTNSTYNNKITDAVTEEIPGAEVVDTPYSGFRVYTPAPFTHGANNVTTIELEDGSQCQVVSKGDKPLWGFLPLGPLGVEVSDIDLSDCE